MPTHRTFPNLWCAAAFRVAFSPAGAHAQMNECAPVTQNSAAGRENPRDVCRLLSALAADSMEGRAAGTPAVAGGPLDPHAQRLRLEPADFGRQTGISLHG